jgi:uroporphyrinogen-III synthase
MSILKTSVLVTRPGVAGEILCEKIRAAGGEAIYFPTLVFAPPANEFLFQQHVLSINQYNWLIFISPQAVAASYAILHAAWPEWPSNVKIAAVGAGTASVLEAAGFLVTVYPAENWSSEGLLALSEFKFIADKKIGLVCGEGGRDYLAKELLQRKAEVTGMIAYRRCVPAVDVTDYVALITAHKINRLVCTSLDGLQNLKHLLFAAWPTLQNIPLVVVSERMQLAARELAFTQILLAKNASHDAIMSVLMKRNSYDKADR